MAGFIDGSVISVITGDNIQFINVIFIMAIKYLNVSYINISGRNNVFFILCINTGVTVL